MKAGTEVREVVRLVMHLNGGFTRVRFERFEGTRDWEIDIPTERIPLGLRAIGDRFVIKYQAMRPESQDSADDPRSAQHDFVVEPLAG